MERRVATVIDFGRFRLVGGWYDSYTRATFQNFVGLSAGGRKI